MFLAFCVDVCVWRSCRRVVFLSEKMNKDEEPKEDTSPSPLPSKDASTTLTIDQNEIESMVSNSSSLPPFSDQKKEKEREDGGEEGEQLECHVEEPPLKTVGKIDEIYNTSSISSTVGNKPLLARSLEINFDVQKFPLRESNI